MPTVLASSTDKKPERVLEIPITPRPGESRQVVMSLGPGSPPYSSIPDLAPGDELEISAELELTTDAPDARWAVKEPYNYSPKIQARLFLASDPDATEPQPGRAKRLTPLRKETCDNEQHHHRLVFEPFSYTIPAIGLPWEGDSYINLVLSAHHAGAQADQVLLIGQNEPPPRKGEPAFVKGDQGKLNVVRFRGTPKPRGRVATARRALIAEVPIIKGRPVVVYSLALPNLEQDEQLVLEASMQTTNPHGYPARVSTGVFLTDSDGGTELPRSARDLIAFHGEIGKSNGTNCMPNQTYTTQKFGTLRVLKSASAPLYANLVVVSADPEHLSRSGDAVKIEPGGFVHVQRLPARVTG
jgi:hypothetical protein